MSRLSIRARIALSGALIAALLLGALAALLAVELRAAASDAVAALARDDLRPFVTDLETQPDEAPDAASPGALVLVVDPAGAVRRDSMPSALARAASGARNGSTVAVDGVRYRVATAAVTVDGGTWHLAAARDVGAGEADATRIGVTLAIAVPIVAAGTGVVAWIVATLVLRPVERMRRAAERIRETRSAEVLPVGPPDDELAALGRTLNGLLGDLHGALEHERRLTADASHELRTPIAVLSAQVELAGSPPTEAEIADIRRSVGRLAVLADDLLELSRPAAGPSAPTPVRDLVTEAMDAVDRGRLLATATAATAVDLELDPALDERATCAIDRVAFGRVLANLLANAVAATAAGSVTVRLDGAPGVVVLSVADTGTGLPPDFLPRAFDRFSRPDDAGARAGAGLGLAVVARLVEAAGGAVSLANRPGAGAVATARLPVEPAGSDAPPARSTPRVSDLRSPEVSTAARPTVLLVCVHNAGRSQIAAGFLRSLAPGRIDVVSAGSEPAETVNPVAVQAMAEAGVDITGAVPSMLSTDDVRIADVVITMGCGDACPVLPGKRYEDWDLPDPAGRPLAEVRWIRDLIRERVEALIAELIPGSAIR